MSVGHFWIDRSALSVFLIWTMKRLVLCVLGFISKGYGYLLVFFTVLGRMLATGATLCILIILWNVCLWDSAFNFVCLWQGVGWGGREWNSFFSDRSMRMGQGVCTNVQDRSLVIDTGRVITILRNWGRIPVYRCPRVGWLCRARWVLSFKSCLPCLSACACVLQWVKWEKEITRCPVCSYDFSDECSLCALSRTLQGRLIHSCLREWNVSTASRQPIGLGRNGALSQ